MLGNNENCQFLDSYFRNLYTRSGIKKLEKNSKMKNSRNKDHAKISESTIVKRFNGPPSDHHFNTKRLSEIKTFLEGDPPKYIQMLISEF